jgi:hypothetical protein
MVNSKLKKAMVGVLLTIVLGSGVLAQGNSEYQALAKYRKWGIVAGPVFYNSAKIYPQYGDYTLENKPMWGFNAGFEYDFYPDRKWSFITGLLVAKEPVYNVHYRIYNKDLYTGYDGDLVDNYKSYAIVTFSAPLLVRLNLQAGNHTFLNFLTGLKVMYFPSGDAYYSYTISNEDNTESREVFGLNLHSQDFSFYGSFVIGTGISYTMRKVLLKTNIIYVMNFQNTIEGEYQFGNLLTSPPTRGDYELSGNYLGLLFSVSLAKSKDKR